MNADDPRGGDLAELPGCCRPRPNGNSRQAGSTHSGSTW